MRNQVFLLVFSAITPAVAAVISIPILSRNLDPSTLQAAMTLLMMNGLFGALDILRPVFVHHFSTEYSEVDKIPGILYLKHTLTISLVACGIMAILSSISPLGNQGWISILSVTTGAFAFLMTTPFWAILDWSHQVGFAQAIRSIFNSLTYITFAVLSGLTREFDYYSLAFAAICSLSLFGFFCATYRKLTLTETRTKSQINRRHIQSTLTTNISKTIIDFSDRILIGLIPSTPTNSAYFVLYDLASKANIIPQYLSALKFPVICRSKDPRRELEIQKLIKYSLYIYSLTIGLALGISTFSIDSVIVSLYAGNKYQSYAYLLPCLLVVAANYSITFFTQATLRAEGKFATLDRHFSKSAIIGLTICLMGVASQNIDAILVATFFLKSPGLIGLKDAFRPYLNPLKFYAFSITTVVGCSFGISSALHFQPASLVLIALHMFFVFLPLKNIRQTPPL